MQNYRVFLHSGKVVVVTAHTYNVDAQGTVIFRTQTLEGVSTVAVFKEWIYFDKEGHSHA